MKKALVQAIAVHRRLLHLKAIGVKDPLEKVLTLARETGITPEQAAGVLYQRAVSGQDQGGELNASD